MKASEIRTKFLEFFKERGHTVVPSDSLVPTNDPSLLFTGAGMNQFKDMFLGKGHLPYTRATSCQKCLRTGDIENVGRTTRHLTFFEMLGNFSFGDYFKREAIEWAWEFVTKIFRLPEARLSVSVYHEDDESYQIWHQVIGLPQQKIFRFGAKENFWPANAPAEGPNGVCGPCSEIFYDLGKDVGCGKPTCSAACDCDRFSEIWNLVFTQFDRQEGGVLVPLPKKNIDTGMGLERAAAVLQGVVSVFETDLFMPIIRELARIVGRKYEFHSPDGPKFRRIADHVRAVTFCISDGVLPSNEGRGYVLRRLIRRALRDGRQLGIQEAFMYHLVPVVAQIMGDTYPDLRSRRENIARIVKTEEEKFSHTLEIGGKKLDEMIAALKASGKKVLSGTDAFKLFDTYGFPLDLAESILAEEGFSVDIQGFQREMERQRQLAKASSSIRADIFDTGPMAKIKEISKGTIFTGYQTTQDHGTVIAIIKHDALVDTASADPEHEIQVVLDHTPFYGEAGGQVGDTGTLTSGDSTMIFTVKDTKKVEPYIVHHGVVTKGTLKVGDTVIARVDAERRADIMRNHTATHILHHVLREVLGQHAEQAGSLVAPDRLRFDFTHFAAVTREELDRIEELVNLKILANEPVVTAEMSLDEAKAKGAIALFGEKYGERVRVVQTGIYSKELCGGTHCARTGDVGLFKIISEQSVAAGVRRIEALTGRKAIAWMMSRDALLRDLTTLLDTQEALLLKRVEGLLADLKAARKEIAKLQSGTLKDATSEMLARAEEVSGVKIIVEKLESTSPDAMRTTADLLRRAAKSAAVVLASTADNKVTLLAAMTPDLVKRGLHAGKIAGEVAKIVGGGGGGRPDMAQAGGKDPSKLDEALQKAKDLIRKGLDAG